MKEKSIEQKTSWPGALLDPGNLLMVVYISVLVCFLLLGGLADSAGAVSEDTGGVQPGEVRRGELLVAMENGRLQPAPLLSQQVNIKVSGIVARVAVEQHFVNTGESWIEAVYVFPLPDESSVDHLRLRVGERILEGRIMEKEEAERTHEQAKNEGRKSSLLVQNRANIFTTRVANIGPGEEVTVEIEYQQTVGFADGVFSLRFPMVVGPRYIPGQSPAEGAEQPVSVNATGWAKNTDQVPDASQITPPVDLAGQTTIPVDMTVDLAAGIPLARIDSLYHGIVSKVVGEGHYAIRLTGEIKADRDFVLEWQPAQTGDAQAALFAETLGNDQYLLLMLMPPQTMAESPVPREVVFILDVSGSMAGTSILQAKAAIAHRPAQGRWRHRDERRPVAGSGRFPSSQSAASGGISDGRGGGQRGRPPQPHRQTAGRFAAFHRWYRFSSQLLFHDAGGYHGPGNICLYRGGYRSKRTDGESLCQARKPGYCRSEA